MITYLTEHNRYLSLLGIFLILGCAWLFSRDRSKISLRTVLTAFGLQVLSALLLLKTKAGLAFAERLAQGVAVLYQYAEQGTNFVFGSLSTVQEPWGFIFAFRVLPVVIFFGALMSLLFHFNIIQWVTLPITRVLYPLLRTSAAETLCTVANSFLGQTEAPLLIRPYLSHLTRSELFTVMVTGMGTISGPLLAVYAGMGVPVIYLLTASIMGVFSALLVAKIIVPEREKTQTAHGLIKVTGAHQCPNMFDAISSGAADGLQLALAVGAILIAFISLIALLNGILAGFSTGLHRLLSLLGSSTVVPTLTVQAILGWLFAPVGWLLGLTGAEATRAGELIGIKLTINEMVAYIELLKQQFSPRALAILTVALCGFANFSSIGIQLAGIGALAPDQRKNLAQLGLLAVLGGMLANLLSACVVSLLL